MLPRWNRFWTALSDASLGLRRKNGSAAVEIFHDIDGHTDVPDYTRLLTATRHHLVAGLILPSPPPLLTHTPLLQEQNVPTVLIARLPVYPGSATPCSIVTPDAESFYDRACAYLKSRGCASVAVVVPGAEEIDSKVMPALLRHQLNCPPYWLHRVLPESAQTVGAIIHLMMRSPNDRPQGLIIADDHFTGPATVGLLAANVRVPEDLHVVVHENFPAQTESLLPFKRLGFDVREVLRACVTNIDRQRQGLAVPRQTMVSALFEDELPATFSFTV
jgi:DNA-binding LacI/PurR family transcriptional regulator